MKSIVRVTAIAALSLLFAGAFAGGPKPTAGELLAQINAIQNPTLDRSKIKDPEYRKQYQADMAKANGDRNKLILEFYQDYPDNTEVPALLEKRWQTLFMGRESSKDDIAAAVKETSDVASSNASPKLKQTAFYYETTFKMQGEENSVKEMRSTVEEFIKAYPADDRGARLLTQIVYSTSDPVVQADIDREIVKDFPNSRDAGYAAGGIRRAESIGKPFDLSFADAISGKQMSVGDLKGKVVLIDFWATWCGPCVAEMPHVKELYAKYHDKGLEILGVSLDMAEAQGGLTKLKDYVAKNQIPWAQYYQGNYWDSKFSTSWGVNSIPRMFMVGKDGNLVDVDAGENIDSKLAKLLDN